MPKVIQRRVKEDESFAVDHYSPSSLVQFAGNPVIFKINQINGEYFNTNSYASGVLGKGFHKAMEAYYGGTDDMPVSNEQEAIEAGMAVGMTYLDMYEDGFINYSKNIPNKQAMFDKFTFMFNEYVKEVPYDNGEEILYTEHMMKHSVNIEWRGKKLTMPVPLKCIADKIVRTKKGEMVIVDYKTVQKFSDPESIDGRKIIQAVINWLCTYAETGEAPVKMQYHEIKHTKNKDGTSQLRVYEMKFAEQELFFDFFFRYYEDVTKAMLGEMVYVPNVSALFDNEVALVAYINRLDVDEEAAKLMQKHKVDNITDLLKKRVASAKGMKRLMETVEKKFVSAKTLDYSKMNNQDKIKMKLMEHGMMLDFEDTKQGASVDLYRYTPSVGIKMSKIKQFTADVEQVLGVSGVRILAPIPDTPFIGFEIPRSKRTYPSVHDVKSGSFNIAMGVDTAGKEFRYDIRQAPHALVAGATGSGKSVFLNSMILQLSAAKRTDIYLADPKEVELFPLQGLNNVKGYASQIEDIHDMLNDAVNEMNARYRKMRDAGVRDIKDLKSMRYRFYIIDEFGDLIKQNYIKTEMVDTGEVYQRGDRKGQQKMKKVETNISQEISRKILLLGQKARAAGIHIWIATQRPSTDIITGTIKANFPTKVVFRTAKAIDSVVVLDEAGAEKLLGKGDMIFASESGDIRLQGYNA